MNPTALLTAAATQALPRILTQVCRDPGSELYGCCDRDWWHYRIRDFPSIILQQAGYTLGLAAIHELAPGPAEPLRSLAAAAGRFWARRAVRHGAFEEYYPFEQGYPPLAFSTLAVARLCAEGLVPLDEIRPGLRAAARQLLTRFEAEAANQQAAGTAALAVIRRLAPELVAQTALDRIVKRTLDLQSAEGWFPEYGGPDLGYLSVTLDCLWDLYDATGASRCLKAIRAAANYVAWFALGPFGRAGMHNARNTDYVLPYGLARLAGEPGESGRTAAEVLVRLYSAPALSEHFLSAIDDRYWCHYVGPSIVRALAVLQVAPRAGEVERPAGRRQPQPQAWPESGHAALRGDAPGGPDVLVSLRKGGILTAAWPDGMQVSDYGWVVDAGRKSFVTHWWTSAWAGTLQDGAARCEGPLAGRAERVSTPWTHMVLRLASLLLGRHLIQPLKRRMIFDGRPGRYRFRRTVRIEGRAVIVEDSLRGLKPSDRARRAPRASKRHVASADSFHPEDLSLQRGVGRTETRQRVGDRLDVLTRYAPQDDAVSAAEG